MTDQTPAPSAAPLRPLSLARVCLAGLYTAIVWGCLLGLAEAALTAVGVGVRYAREAPIPWSAFLGALARILLTHGLFWPLVFAVIWLPTAAWLARRSARQRIIAPAVPALLLFLPLAAAVTLPAALDVANNLRPAWLIPAVLATLLLWALLAFILLAAPGLRRLYCNLLRRAAIAALPLLLLCWFLMDRSPFCGAARFRVATAATAPFPVPPDGPPNIVLLILDTVRRDRLSCYGHDRPTTPFLDRLAAESDRYDRAFANAEWTVPTHASIFTGLPARTHGASHDHAFLDPAHTTIAELLQQHGYRTALFANNPHISRGRNFTQGFDAAPQVYQLHYLERFSLLRAWEWLGCAPPPPFLEADGGAAVTNALIAADLDRASAADPRPFLLVVNYMDAHLPYPAPARDRRPFMDRAQLTRSYAIRYRPYGDVVTALNFHFNMLDNDLIPEPDLDVLRRQYDASILYLDSRLEEIYHLLAARGLLETTYLIVTSDHGEYLHEHGLWGHDFGLYNPLIHVPLLVRPPGPARTASAGDAPPAPRNRITRLVQTSDLFATIARWTASPLPDTPGLNSIPLDADSWHASAVVTATDPDGSPDHRLQSAIRNPQSAIDGDRAAIAEYLSAPLFPVLWASGQDPNFQKGRFTRTLRAVVDWPYKYIWSSDGRHELYHLADDPREQTNLIGSRPATAERLHQRLDEWTKSTPAFAIDPQKKMPDLPPSVVNQLKSLGYMR